MKIQNQISQTAYKSENGFINAYQKLITNTVIPYQYRVLWDDIEGVEKSHVVKNFINAGKALRGEDIDDGFYGMVFQDSDAGKWLEACAYSLSNFPDEELEKCADELIDIISKAQDEDGYLNTYFTIKDKDRRWRNLLEGHELYCAGHLMESACAYYEATGKKSLVNICEKNCEHIYDHFLTQKHSGFSGHPEIELALLKMYRVTKNEHCLELAKHFINSRGQDPNFFLDEFSKRDWTVWGNDASDNNYQQSAKPVREQSDATGHAVRAVYLYTGMADLASMTNDEELFNACKRLWKSITQKQMYITGGIGSTVLGEAFSVDYDLPPDTAYAETCASIGLMFFASRMLENDVDSEYADVMEQAFYNTVLAGMSLDGKKFFYVNPLECVLGISGKAQTHKHDLTQRPEWFTCACCPPNVARVISSLGKYAYGENSDTAFCHLYAEGTVTFYNGIKLKCETSYPYNFTIDYTIYKGGNLAIRIPHWSKKFNLTKNGENIDYKMEKGYAYISVNDGDKIQLLLDGTPRFAHANTKVSQLTGKTALCVGPLVYCFEGADNGDVLSLLVKKNADVQVLPFDEKLLNGTRVIKCKCERVVNSDSLYYCDDVKTEEVYAYAVPYYTWGNRGENDMRVWLDETK